MFRYIILLFTYILSIGLNGCRPSLPEDIEIAYQHLPDELDYNAHVKPILSDKCFACHGPDQSKMKAGLRLDSPEFAYAELSESPGKFAIKKGDLNSSEFFHRIITDDPDKIMPTPSSHLTLSAYEKAVLIRWIDEGAIYKPHWSFVKPESPKLPSIKNKELAKNAIDYFILEKLEQQNLSLSKQADKETLLRRVSMDLTGLPPTPSEITSFLKDNSTNAYENVVDRLLKSPHYGEKMATYWLDLARFSDSHGYTVDRIRDMSPYRDYVINAFNTNKPYDQFLHEQLAGDLFQNPTREQLIATAFNRNHQQNSEGGIVEAEFQTEYVVDRTNTFGDALLGLSLSCAKCHDHKYDPLTQKNYFELFSFFNNVQEAGQISWDDAMPAPTLLLTTPIQEQSISTLQQRILNLEKQLVQLPNINNTAFTSWIANLQYQQLLRKPIPTIGLQGHFPLDKSSFENKVQPSQRGVFKHSAGSTDETPIFVKDDNQNTLELNGDTYLDLTPTGVFRKSNPFTIGIWMKIPKDLKEGVIFHKSIAERLFNYRGYHLYLKDNKLEASLSHAYPGNALTIVSNEAVPKDQWVHVTMRYDGSARANGLQLYLNGSRMESEVIADDLVKDILFYSPSQVGLQIGGWWRGVGIKGARVRNVTVHNRALSAIELQQLAQNDGIQLLAQKSVQQLTSAELKQLSEFYFTAIDKSYQQTHQLLTEARTILADSIIPIQELMVMREMKKPKKSHLRIRGNYDELGEEVFPNTPATILPFPDSLPKNRLGLAKWLTHSENPLTSRVAINHLWQNLFGTGLVKTAEDFGNQGELPSHPKLMDWLAVDFQNSGWDIKKMIKQMVMSATYQQTSWASDQIRAIDPENRLLARGPSKRLSAEMLRDNALAASGLLKKEIGGKSFKPYQPDGLWEINSATYKRDTGEIIYRRSLYILAKRSVPNPTLATFDASSRSYCVIRRQPTNTPLQALVTLNDPTYLEAARVLAHNSLQHQDIQQGIHLIYQKLTGKRPTEAEITLLKELYTKELDAFTASPNRKKGLLQIGQKRADAAANDAALAAATIIASTILNSDATITLR